MPIPQAVDAAREANVPKVVLYGISVVAGTAGLTLLVGVVLAVRARDALRSYGSPPR